VVTSKAGSEFILKCLLGREDEIDLETLPYGDEDRVPAGIETVVGAQPVGTRPGVRLEEIIVNSGVREVVVKTEPED